ncbi:MAG TPA: transposase [Pirellulales bacterium]|nr:transposase [Pirellulales bacterium]
MRSPIGGLMRFICPELFVRINEACHDEAESLYQSWEAIGQEGRAYYLSIKDRIPPKLAEFNNAICLQDAEWMGISESPSRKGTHGPVAVINIRQNNDVVSLVYDLYEEPRRNWNGGTAGSRNWRSCCADAMNELRNWKRDSPISRQRWRGCGKANSLSHTVLLYGRTRDASVLDEILPCDRFQGIGVSDDYAAYRERFPRNQKCWSHLLRKAIALMLAHPAKRHYRRSIVAPPGIVAPQGVKKTKNTPADAAIKLASMTFKRR